ncbi:MAG: hypothetical protein ACUVQG_03865 [Thermogutta sp.]
MSSGEFYGLVFQNATATFLARVLGYDGQPVQPSQIASVRYTVAEYADDLMTTTPVQGHTDVVLSPTDVLFATLQKDALWDLDDVGYNFRHVIDVSQAPAFPVAGGHYRVEYRLTPQAGQVIVVRFRVKVL